MYDHTAEMELANLTLMACMFIAQWDFVYLVNCTVSKFQQGSIEHNARASYKTFFSSSPIQCAQICASVSECRSVSYSEASKLCHMMSYTALPQDEPLNEEGLQSYTKEGTCPPEYTFIGWTCLKMSSVSSHYTSASDACLSDGAVLAQMTPVRLFDEIVRHMFNNGWASTGWVWVGSDDFQEEGTWRWNDGALVTPWCDGEPNSSDEHCLCLSVTTDGGACLNDCHCTMQAPYLCQKLALGATTC